MSLPAEALSSLAAPGPAPRYLDLNPLQAGVVDDPARFKIVVCGRRWGKTWTARTWLAQGADQRCRLWYVAPTYRLAHDIVWRELLDTIPPDWYARAPNVTRLEIELRTGALLQVKGADDPDSLRGRGVTRMVIDEYADMPDVWDEILRPALADTNGGAMIIGTPKGHNHFHRLYQRGRDGGDPEWRAWHYPTWSAPHFQTRRGRAELAAIQASTPPHIWRQEYGAEFSARAGMIVGPLWEATHVLTPTDTPLLAGGRQVGEVVPWHVHDDPRWRPPPEAHIYGAVDYGYGAPWAAYLTALLPDGHTRTFWEGYGPRLQDRAQAQQLRDAILHLERTAGVQRPQWVLGEPLMFASRAESGQQAIADIYTEILGPIGVQMLRGAGGRPARLSRPQRWLQALGTAPDGWPWWSVTTACPHLIRTVPEVPWDDRDVEVEDDRAENHAYEAMGRYFEARPHVPKVAPPDPYVDLDPLSRAEAERVAAFHQRRGPRGLAAAFGGPR
jgi:hypothetical protein